MPQTIYLNQPIISDIAENSQSLIPYADIPLILPYAGDFEAFQEKLEIPSPVVVVEPASVINNGNNDKTGADKNKGW